MTDAAWIRFPLLLEFLVVALLVYAITNAIKGLLRLFPSQQDRRVHDWLARTATLLWGGGLGAWIISSAPTMSLRVGLGAVAGLLSVPLYHAVRSRFGSAVANFGAPGVGPKHAPPAAEEDQ